MVWKQIIGYVPVNLANILVSFGSILILTRLLSAEEYGVYALVLVSMHMCHTVIFTWMEAAMERYYARAQREGDLRDHMFTLYRTALTVVLIGSLIFSAIIWLLPFDREVKTVLAFALGSTAIQAFVNLGFEAHKAANHITRYSLTRSGWMILSFTIGIVLIMTTPLRAAGPFVGIMLGCIVILILDFPYIYRQIKGGKLQPQRRNNYLIYGLPICFSLILEQALSTSDRFVIAAMLGEADVGRYSAGYGLANRSIDVLFIWIGLAVTPVIVRTLEHEGMAACLEQLKQYGSTLLFVTMPAAVGLGLVAEPVSILLGESVREAGAKIIPWIVGAGVVNGMISYYLQRAFMLSGKTLMLPIIMTIPMILNIGLNIILLPKFGLMGAVYATLISYALGFILALLVARKYFALPIPWKAFIQCGFACIVMAFIVSRISLNPQINPFIEVAIKGSAGAVTYALVCFAINAADCRNLIGQAMTRFRQKKGVLEA